MTAAKTPGVAQEEGLWKSSRTPPQEKGGGCDEDERGKGRGRRGVQRCQFYKYTKQSLLQ